MFLLRSAFWLTIGFLIVAPHGTNFGATASQIRDGAVAAGVAASEQIVAASLTGGLSPRQIVSSLVPAHAVSPMQANSAMSDVVVPHPRPAAMG